MGYTLAQLRGYFAAVARQAQEKAQESLLIARGSQADEKGWKKLWKAFSPR
jgi:hypothetical protein